MSAPLFEARAVSASVGDRPILRDLSFHIHAGERVVLLGVNGCGKTTLIKLLDGLHFPSAGTLAYAGRALDARAFDEPPFRRTFRGEVALLFQNVDAMLFCPTVADEIAFGPRQLGLPEVERRVATVGEAFGVTRFFPRAPFDLSGGEKKRVALAALLAISPKVLLLDEATAGLDPAWSGVLIDYLADHPELTVIASTHNLTLAEELGSRAILLGRDTPGILFDGPTADVVNDEALLIRAGLAHRHRHRHAHTDHAHYHVHDTE